MASYPAPSPTAYSYHQAFSEAPPPSPKRQSPLQRLVLTPAKLPVVSTLLGLGLVGLVLSQWGYWRYGLSGAIFSRQPPPEGQSPTLPFKTFLTGNWWWDGPFTLLAGFFSALLDGRKDRDLAVFYLWCMAQFAGAWTLLLLESLRNGNRGRFVSWVAPLALVLQPLGFTTFIPIYLALHLVTSPIALSFPGTYASSVLLVDSYDLFTIPLSVTYGLGLSSAMMAVPSSAFSPWIHYVGIVTWRFFPVWTFVLQATMSRCYRGVWRSVGGGEKVPSISQGLVYLNSARFVFFFVQSACVLVHVSCLAWAVLPDNLLDFLPNWFGHWEEIYKALFSATTFGVFLPESPFNPPVANPADRASLMRLAGYVLRWDMYSGFGALLVWAVFLYLNAGSERLLGGQALPHLPIHKGVVDGKPGSETKNIRRLAAIIAGWCIAGGPVAATAWLLKERDGIVREKFKMGV